MAGLSDIVGNKLTVHSLNRAIENNKLAHCYIISGQDGLGKRTLAKNLAMTVQCEAAGGKPCGVCASCKQVMNEDHPDVIFVTHEKTNTFSVDDVREKMNQTIHIKPYKSEKKIYILEDTELMNVQAQNAILKTIEEPPSYAMILLLSSNREGFLPTILSRCVSLEMRPVTNQELEKYIDKNCGTISVNREHLIQFAQGNIGKALDFLQKEEYQELYKTVLDILKDMPDYSLNEIREKVAVLMEYKDNMSEVISLMMTWFRDVLLYKSSSEKAEMMDESYQEAVRRQAQQYSYEDINRIFEEIAVFQTRFSVNVNTELSLEQLFMKARPEKKTVFTET